MLLATEVTQKHKYSLALVVQVTDAAAGMISTTYVPQKSMPCVIVRF